MDVKLIRKGKQLFLFLNMVVKMQEMFGANEAIVLNA